MTLMSDVFWQYLGNFVNFISLLTLIFSGYTAIKLFRQSRRLREQARVITRLTNFKEMREINEGVGIAPVALAFSLTSSVGSLKPFIERFFKQEGWHMPIEEINCEGVNTPEDIEWLVQQVREKRRIIEANGHTDVHVFFSGPVAASLIVGSLLVRWLPVKVYHRPTPGDTYVYWMPLL